MVEMENVNNTIDELDWRHKAATSLANDALSPISHKLFIKGTPVIPVTFVKHKGIEMSFGVPSATAIFLNLSYKSFGQAMNNNPSTDNKKAQCRNMSSTSIFDYLEEISASIIYSYTALEAFSNEEIPEDFIYESIKKVKSGSSAKLHYNKDQIERFCSLSEKFATILPEALNLPSPKGTTKWQNFIYLEQLRNSLIHMKSKDRLQSKQDEMYPDSIWSRLLEPKQKNFPLIAKNLILHFKNIDTAHWLKYCPF